VEGEDRSQFFGVNADIQYLSEWIELFVNRHDRWGSPKFLIGESYGTTRVAGMARELQRAQKMFFNGVILVSPTGLGHQPGRTHQRGAEPAPLRRHRLVLRAAPLAAPEPRPGRGAPEEVEEFTLDEYIPGPDPGRVPELAGERQAMARQVGEYAGVSPSSWTT
jgi:hypothetical protein